MNDRIDILAEYAACADLVQTFRAQYSAHWPTPSTADCLRYAITEAGEALSDLLREQQPDHKRNHAHAPDVAGELGDCLIMLLSAFAEPVDGMTIYPYDVTIESLMSVMILAVQRMPYKASSTAYYLHHAKWMVITLIIDRDRLPREVVAERLAGIKAKHVPLIEGGQR
jgi:hypothetical protein